MIGVGSFEVAANLGVADTCLYLTPTDVLRSQVYGGVSKALEMIGSSRPIRKILADNAALGRIEAGAANFIVATYQQVVAAPRGYVALGKSRRLHIVCDEAHHLGERGRWAEAISQIPAASQILLSATPVRRDRDAIASARYVAGEDGFQVIEPLLDVSMRQAWKERRILKHLNVQMKDYAVQLRNAEGETLEFTASEMAELPDFDQRCVRQQLRWNEDYVAPLVREFARTLQAKMGMAPNRHQGLVFAATTEHANHLARVFERYHPELRCVVVHSVAISDAANDRSMREFHAGRYDVLIQVKKASEGFDRPAVSVLLKLDAVFSREPVIQQLGRGLRFNHELPESQNLLNVFIGRDPRLAGMIELLEREAPPAPLALNPAGLPIGVDEPADVEVDEDDAVDLDRPEVLAVAEAGDVHMDHTGAYVDGQQLAFFGVSSPPPAARTITPTAAVAAVEDLDAALREAIEYCRSWTNRAARARTGRRGPAENHHAALNLQYARESGRRGALSTAAEYRAKGDWMKRQYSALIS